MIRMCVVMIFLIGLHTQHAYAVLDGTCDAGAGGACTGEDNAALCNSETTPACICDINYEVSGTNCVLKTCTLGTDNPVTACGANTACSSNECACAINFEVVVSSTPSQCTAIACTSADASGCTDPNAYCDTTTTNACQCGGFSVGTNLASCGSKTCSLSGVVATTCGTNTVCELLEDTPNEYKCACLANYSPSEAGCAQTECTTGNVATDCGTNFQCVDLKCACPTNFVARGSSCQRDCSSDTTTCDNTNAACVGGACFCNANYKGDGATCTLLTGCSTNDLTMCHPNSKCSAPTGGDCLCADTYTASGTLCKKDCSSDSTVCHANAVCTSNVCQCNVNYEGDGATCTQKTCTGTDATSCHANSKCVSDKCQCANNFEPSGQTCVACPNGWEGDGTVCKKTCSSDTDCGSTTAVCTSSVCECATNYAGNGTSCTAKTCTANSDCTTANNYTCTSGSCACAVGYSFSSTERDCIMNSAGGINFYSLFLMIAALLLSIFTSKI